VSRADVQSGAAAKTAVGTGFVYDAVYLKHDIGANHPERPARLTAIVERLEQKGLLKDLVRLKPTPSSLEWITTVHTPEYVERVRKSCQEGTGYVDSPDAPASRGSYEAALNAVGGLQVAIDAVMEGYVRNAFCAVRPPGHHALKDKAMGFCLFNNVAAAARYIQKKHKLGKVLIVDWDVHHGNGTQAMFYDDPTVFYFSVHQSPFYPGTGSAEEKGTGKGLGFTCNVPLAAGCGDAEYRKAFLEKLRPAAAAFKPDFVLVSAGFDAAKDDLLGQMKVTPEGFAELTRIVKGLAEQYCQGRLVTVLEGGYNLESLAACVEAHVRVLMQTTAGPETRGAGPGGASTKQFDEESIQQWTREQPLGETPKRLTEDLPLSDQENRGRWVKFEPMWDVFDGLTLDSNKWMVGMSWWQGRPPAWFNPTNVVVRDGQLHLIMRKEAVPRELASRGYHDYTSAALHTKARSSYGFYEVKARAMNSAGSSSFWFQQEDHQANPGWSSEVDVFELCGKSATHDQRYYMTVHIFGTPQERRHWQVGSFWRVPWRFAEQFHVYGFEWGRDQLRWYVDGQLVRTVQNTHWHQSLYLIFDSETMPDWFGLPEDADLPSTFSVEYVRAWKHQG
jgi:acetoin utilization deacetylase AcuC-like enzyme